MSIRFPCNHQGYRLELVLLIRVVKCYRGHAVLYAKGYKLAWLKWFNHRTQFLKPWFDPPSTSSTCVTPVCYKDTFSLSVQRWPSPKHFEFGKWQSERIKAKEEKRRGDAFRGHECNDAINGA
ncbi:hypothetical protein VNO77_34432 [Canavalia gladiata]|uniref:Uncharacterized protein n=1 Tax=Canavalia gladiata TaxID=3824 RepID=A0AAN9KDK4_CANGL